MLFSFKYFSIQVLVIIGLLASSNSQACAPENALNENNVDIILFSTATPTPNKSQARQHTQMLGNSSSENESNASHKNCKCCEYGGCINCVGCTGLCGAVIISTSFNSEINTSLGRLVQMRNIYASFSSLPLDHPPK